MKLHVQFTHKFENFAGSMVECRKWATIVVDNIEQNTMKKTLEKTGCYGEILSDIVVDEIVKEETA